MITFCRFATYLSLAAFGISMFAGSLKGVLLGAICTALAWWLYHLELNDREDREIVKEVLAMLKDDRMTYSYIRAELALLGYEPSNARLKRLLVGLKTVSRIRDIRITNNLTHREETYFELK